MRLEALSSNRTFMELKLPTALMDAKLGGSSNRTFMELKLMVSLRICISFQF